MKSFLLSFAGVAAALLLFNRLKNGSFFYGLGSTAGVSDGVSGTDASIGGVGGLGGAGGSGSGSDYASLASAIQALAAGVALPNIKTFVKTCSSGDTELVALENGKRVCVLAYAITGAATITGKWRGGGSVTNLWEIDLDAAAGNSGANLSTAWPGYLFATNVNQSLSINLNAAATVAVTYWTEVQ